MSNIEKKLDGLIDALGFDVEEMPGIGDAATGRILVSPSYKLTKKPVKRSSNGHLSWCVCDECKPIKKVRNPELCAYCFGELTTREGSGGLVTSCVSCGIIDKIVNSI
ncbi:hypothetical protein KAR91_46600 [Candidatus Pacearchaeota archaeon]|nr:hypothetical protein [Candidatus Pacearchaeota archaeon]